jgi:photosystem II stability/assembly factor-like uncharacterized protein
VTAPGRAADGGGTPGRSTGRDGNPWRLVATRFGGTVATLQSVPDADGSPIVFATTPAGLHYSTDAGHTWATTTLGQFGPSVTLAAASPAFARDRTLFVGTESSLFRSADAGATWQEVLTGSRMLAITLSPAFEGDQLLFVGTETDGVLRSDDGGRRWASANPGMVDLTVLALALSPRFDVDRTAFAATSAGLHRSRNGGKSWREIELPVDEPAVQCLAISPTFGDDRLVVAGTEAHGLLRSVDGGTTWATVPELADSGVTAVAFAPADAAQPALAVATADAVGLSADGGESWQLEPLPDGPALSLAFVPDGPGATLLAGLPRVGVVRRGREPGWSPARDGLEGSLLVSLACSPAFDRDHTLFVAGLEDGVSRSTDAGATWTPSPSGPPTVFDLAVSPAFERDGTLFAAAADGLHRSRDRGCTWELVHAAPVRAVALAHGSTPELGSATGTEAAPALVVAARRDGGLLLSTDGGETWRAEPGPAGPHAPAPPPARPGAPTGPDASTGPGAPLPPGAPAPPATEVIALALSPRFARDGILFLGLRTAGADGPPEVRLWRSPDRGQSWQSVLVRTDLSALPLAVAAEASGELAVFVGVGDRVLRPLRQAQEVVHGERRPIWRGDALPDEPGTVTALAASPEFGRDGVLLASTSTGVYRSRTAGATFDRWSEGLTAAPVVALAVAAAPDPGRTVFALQLGGSIWSRGLG